MVSAARHNELVDFILDKSGDLSQKQLEEAMISRFGDLTFPDLDKAMLDAAGILRERAAEHNAEADELLRFMPLFEGCQKTDVLYDVAKLKAAAGNQLAVEFLRWCGKPEEVFVFGSNLAGRHGKGAALTARLEYGAIRGCGEGLQGRSYAIPTKSRSLRTLPLSEVEAAVSRFLAFARARQDLRFSITPIGCGLAGYKRHQIRPFFEGMPNNCFFASTWDEPDE